MKELVAQRIPPGDRWTLLNDDNDYGCSKFAVGTQQNLTERGGNWVGPFIEDNPLCVNARILWLVASIAQDKDGGLTWMWWRRSNYN